MPQEDSHELLVRVKCGNLGNCQRGFRNIKGTRSHRYKQALMHQQGFLVQSKCPIPALFTHLIVLV